MIVGKPSTQYCFVLALAFLAGCNPCKEEVWSNVNSPDGKWTATTKFQMQTSLSTRV